jgi:predicted AAA+ superfamily ATPase
VIRGPRQYGKSTWLEFQLRETIRRFGPGAALFLNGDYIAGPDELEREIESLVRVFPAEALIRRLFIDEITAVAGWQKAVKRLVDSGTLRKVLLVTTGSKATDIQREAEYCPDAKGSLRARSIRLCSFHTRCFMRRRSQCSSLKRWRHV